MASDDRERKTRSFARRKATRKPYERILVVCEGEETEPKYLIGLRKLLHLSHSEIEVTGDCQSDPLKVIEFARAKSKEQSFDRVYCVFDHDGRDNFDAAVARTRSCKFIPVTSVPCAEIWMLLHFRFTERQYDLRAGCCNAVVSDLKMAFPEYRKADDDIFAKLAGRLADAMSNAVALEKANAKLGVSNPRTDIHRLVSDFFALKAQACWSDEEVKDECAALGVGPHPKKCFDCHHL